MISQKTKELAVAVIIRHVDLEQAIRLFEELSGVPGNASFQASVVAMYAALVDARPKNTVLEDAARGRDPMVKLVCPKCGSGRVKLGMTRLMRVCESCGHIWTVKGGDA